MTWKVRTVSLMRTQFWVLRQDKDYSAKETESISWQAMVAFSCGPIAVEDWCIGFFREEVRQRQKMHASHEREHWRRWRWGACFKSRRCICTRKIFVEPCITLSTKMALLWIWLSHVGNFWVFFDIGFLITYISETVLRILSKLQHLRQPVGN